MRYPPLVPPRLCHTRVRVTLTGGLTMSGGIEILGTVFAKCKIDETEKDNPVHIEFGTMVEEAPPEIQSSNGKGIDLYSYIGLTTKAVQELSQKVETLEQKIAELEAENQALKQ